MAQNSLRPTGKTTFMAYMTNDAVKKQISDVLGGEDAQRFISSIISAVTTNPALAECSNASIVSAALLGESLKLSPSPQLGYFYIVPYQDRKNNRTVATFQIGYRGLWQLAIRSGQYKKINVLPLKEGELVKYDPMTEEIEVNLIEDEELRAQKEDAWYFAMYELTNGFRKTLLWSRAKMEAHAKKYSMGYANDLKRGTSFTFWSKDFSSMACKTMLRQLIGRYGVMSTTFQRAYEADMAYIHEDGTPEYVDNEPIQEPIETPVSEVVEPEKPKATKKSAKAEPEIIDAPEPTDEELAAFFAGAPIEG